MARSEAGRGGLRSFTLKEVPEALRFRALDKLLRTDGSKDGLLVASPSLSERIALGAAAHRPSDRRYWIGAAAHDRVFRERP